MLNELIGAAVDNLTDRRPARPVGLRQPPPDARRARRSPATPCPADGEVREGQRRAHHEREGRPSRSSTTSGAPACRGRRPQPADHAGRRDRRGPTTAAPPAVGRAADDGAPDRHGARGRQAVQLTAGDGAWPSPTCAGERDVKALSSRAAPARACGPSPTPAPSSSCRWPTSRSCSTGWRPWPPPASARSASSSATPAPRSWRPSATAAGSGLEVTYLPQDAPLGLAHCVLIAGDFLGDDDFVMYLGDNLLEQDLAGFVGEFERARARTTRCRRRPRSC